MRTKLIDFKYIGMLCPLWIATLMGCGDPLSNRPFEDDASFTAALPTSEQLEVQVPDSTESSSSKASAEKSGSNATQVEGCDTDFYRTYTFQITEQLNGYVANMLDLLDTLRQNEPSLRETDRRVWGPYRHPQYGFYVRLEVVRASPVFHYVLSLGWDEAGDSDILMEGNYYPGSTSDEGEGDFSYSLDVLSAYSPDASRLGTLVVDYNTWGASRDLSLLGYDLTEEGSSAAGIDEEYAFYTPGDGSGLFYFGLPANVYGDDNLEQVKFYSSWQGSGLGRADASFQGGDLGNYVATAVQCWADDQSLLYFQNPGCDVEGAESSCVASVVGWPDESTASATSSAGDKVDPFN